MSSTDVPRPFDIIEVLFEVDQGDMYWWPGEIVESEEIENSSLVSGMAQIEFYARMKTPKTLSRLFFLGNHTVITPQGHTPWRTWTEEADAGSGDADEIDWEMLANGHGSSGKQCAPGYGNGTDIPHGTNKDEEDDSSSRQKNASTVSAIHGEGTCAGCASVREIVDDVVQRVERLENVLAAAAGPSPAVLSD